MRVDDDEEEIQRANAEVYAAVSGKRAREISREPTRRSGSCFRGYRRFVLRREIGHSWTLTVTQAYQGSGWCRLRCRVGFSGQATADASQAGALCRASGYQAYRG